MLIKFPQITDNGSDHTFIHFGAIPYAKHNTVIKNTGQQIGFLTEHSVMFIMQGKKYFHFGQQTICVNSNEIILVKRGVYTISEFIPQDGCFEALIIFLPDKFLQSLYRHKNFLNSNSSTTAHLILKCNSVLQQFRSNYLTYFNEEFNGRQEILTLKLQELFLLLRNAAPAIQLDEFINACISKESIDMEYIIKSNLFQPLSIKDYAKLCLRSLASFKRDFKKQYHTSPKKWINEQRIQHAVSLLNSTHNTVSEIAFDCGFESTSNFIKLFKNQMGYTPKAIKTKATII